MNEEEIRYATIPGLPNHQVGTDGSIWTKAKFGPQRGERRGEYRRMKPSLDKDGYPRVTIGYEGKLLKPMKVHTLVLLTFVGPCPD